MTAQPLRPETILRLRDAVIPSYALLAGIQLNIFTTLQDGPMTGAEIAGAIGVGVDKLRVLLYALVTVGLLVQQGDSFSNSDEAAHFLVRDKPNYLGGMYESFPDRWAAILKTSESIRSGKAEAKVNYSTMNPNELQFHYRGFYMITVATARELVARYDFSSCKTLLDVGGGPGGLAITIAQECPGILATVVDLPSVTPITQQFVDEAGVSNEVRVLTRDIVHEPLEGLFDVAVMSAIFPVLSPSDLRLALVNVSNAMQLGGMLYVVDAGFLDDSRLSPQGIVLNNLWFINVFDNGGARTMGERLRWLSEAGFEVTDQASLQSGRSVMAARKVV